VETSTPLTTTTVYTATETAIVTTTVSAACSTPTFALQIAASSSYQPGFYLQVGSGGLVTFVASQTSATTFNLRGIGFLSNGTNTGFYSQSVGYQSFVLFTSLDIANANG